MCNCRKQAKPPITRAPARPCCAAKRTPRILGNGAVHKASRAGLLPGSGLRDVRRLSHHAQSSCPSWSASATTARGHGQAERAELFDGLITRIEGGPVARRARRPHDKSQRACEVPPGSRSSRGHLDLRRLWNRPRADGDHLARPKAAFQTSGGDQRVGAGLLVGGSAARSMPSGQAMVLASGSTII